MPSHSCQVFHTGDSHSGMNMAKPSHGVLVRTWLSKELLVFLAVCLWN